MNSKGRPCGMKFFDFCNTGSEVEILWRRLRYPLRLIGSIILALIGTSDGSKKPNAALGMGTERMKIVSVINYKGGVGKTALFLIFGVGAQLKRKQRPRPRAQRAAPVDFSLLT